MVETVDKGELVDISSLPPPPGTSLHYNHLILHKVRSDGNLSHSFREC